MQQVFTSGRLSELFLFLMVSLMLTAPAAGQGYVDNGQRYAMYTLYDYGPGDLGMHARQIRGMEHAFANGCNSVVIGISWGGLLPHENSTPNWGYIDRFVEVARQHNAKIALRLQTCRGDKVGFWTEEQTMRDTRGRMMQAEGRGHVRLGYAPGIDKIQDFARLVTQHYKYLNDRGELLFMSVTFNPQWENEHWQQNSPDNTSYFTTYDYNENTIQDFQRWALTKYATLDAINRAWGANYGSATEIRPTYPNADNNGAFSGKRGLDWYTFRHLQLKSFNDRFSQTIKSVDPTIRVVTEQGAVYDTPNRGTLGFKSLSELSDGVKVNDAPQSIHQFSMDLLRSNLKPGTWVINELDGMLFRDPSTTEMLSRQLETSFKFGAKIVTFANYFMDYNQETQMKDVLDGMRAKGLLNQPVSTVTPMSTMTYKMSSVVQNNVFETGIFGQWVGLRGNSEKPVRILLDEDLLTGTTAPPDNQPPTVASRVPDQTTTVSKSFSFKIPDGTFADADGQITAVGVSGLPVGLTYEANTRTISGTPTLVNSSEITVVATDNKNATVSDYFVLAVRQTTLPLRLLDPILDCGTGRFEFRSTEGNGSPVEYAADNLYSWNTQTVYTLGDQLRHGSVLTLRAKQDGAEVSLNYTTTCPTASDNKPPVVNVPVGDHGTSLDKSLLVILPVNTFTDPDGEIVSVALSGLPPGINYTPSTRVLEGTATGAGTWIVTATATDNRGATVTTSFRIVISGTSAPKPLRLLDPVVNCVTGQFDFKSADGDGTAIEYAADGLYSWNVRTTYTLDHYLRYDSKFTIRARQSGVDYVLYYTTVCSVGNKPPVVSTTLPNQVNTVNQPLSVLIPASTFTDPDGQIVSVAVNGLPPGLSYEAATRLISGTVSTVGVWTVTVTATDDKGATGSTTFTITVGREVRPLRLLDPVLNCVTGAFEFRSADGDGTTVEYSIDRTLTWTSQTSTTLSAAVRTGGQLDIKARQSGQIIASVYYPDCSSPNKLPTVKSSIANQTLFQNRPISVVIPATTFEDSDGTIDQINLTGLPPGLVYELATRTVSGAPTTVGNWTVAATATDNAGGTVANRFVVTVISTTKPLRVLSPVVNCNTGRFEFRTADGDGTVVGYSIDRVLNWTNQPTYTLADGLRYGTVLVVRVRQSGIEQSLNYTTACVRANKPPVVAMPLADQVLTVNQAASFSLAAGTFTDPDGTIASVTLTGLPVGLSYDPAKRTIKGTPTLIGTSPAIARATDNAGASVSDTFLITVRVIPRFAVTTMLLDARGKILKELVDSDVLDSRKMPALVNLSCQPKVAAGSVQMELTGKAKRTVYANAAPYLLFPSGQGAKPEVGAYQLKTSVYSGANGTGTLLGVSTIRFEVIVTNEGGSAPPATSDK